MMIALIARRINCDENTGNALAIYRSMTFATMQPYNYSYGQDVTRFDNVIAQSLLPSLRGSASELIIIGSYNHESVSQTRWAIADAINLSGHERIRRCVFRIILGVHK